MCVVRGLGGSHSPHRPHLPIDITPHVEAGESLCYPAFGVTVTFDEVNRKVLGQHNDEVLYRSYLSRGED